MEERRMAMNEKEIREVLNKLRDYGRYEENVISLVKKDLEYGLTRSETDLYLNERLKIGQMRKVSQALRKHGKEFASMIAREELDESCMQLAIDYYEKGVSLKMVEDAVAQKVSAHHLQEIFTSMLKEIKEAEKKEQYQTGLNQDFIEKVIADMKEVVLAIHHNSEKYDALTEKLMSKKQDEALLKELEEKNREIEGLQEEIRSLKEQLMQKEEKNMKESVQMQIPASYVATIQSRAGQPPITAILEREQPKRAGLYALAGKLMYKKKSKQDLIKLVATGALSPEQLGQIKAAMEKNLTEDQLLELIHGNLTVEQMKEIIEIAVLENQMK